MKTSFSRKMNEIFTCMAAIPTKELTILFNVLGSVLVTIFIKSIPNGFKML